MGHEQRAGRLERLSPIDVSNLRVERRGAAMHVAAIAVAEGAGSARSPGQRGSGNDTRPTSQPAVSASGG